MTTFNTDEITEIRFLVELTDGTSQEVGVDFNFIDMTPAESVKAVRLMGDNPADITAAFLFVRLLRQFPDWSDDEYKAIKGSFSEALAEAGT